MRQSILESDTAERTRRLEQAPGLARGRRGARALLREAGRPWQVGLAIVVLYVMMAIFAPLIAPHDPVQIFSGQIRKPPSAQFLMGTDEVGRDILSRVIYGSRVS